MKLSGLSKTNLLFIIAIIIISLLALSPVLASGYLSDDYVNSLANGYLIVDQIDLPQLIINMTQNYFLSLGRIYLYALTTFSIFSLIDNLFLYKLLLVAFTILNILLFAYFVKLLTNSFYLSMLSALLVPLMVQLRYDQDPIMSYALWLPLTFFYIILSLIFLILFVKKGKKIYFLLSLLLYLISLFTYEITYPFFLLHAAILFLQYSGKFTEKIKLSLSFFILPVLASLLIIVFRIFLGMPLLGGSSVPRTGSGSDYIPHLDIIVNIKTVVLQSINALPLTYYYFDPRYIFHSLTNPLHGNLLIIVLIFIASLVLFIILLKSISNNAPGKSCDRNILSQVVCGSMLWILPGAMISLSTKYQAYISMAGMAYLPIYISYFGVAMIVAAFLDILLRKITVMRKAYIVIFIAVASLVLSTMIAINYNNNSLVVECTNVYWKYPRSLIEDGMKNGLIDVVPEQSTLLVDDNFVWDTLPFYDKGTGKRFGYIGSKGYSDAYIQYLKDYRANSFDHNLLVSENGTIFCYRGINSDRVYYLSYRASSDSDGYAILSDVRDIRLSNNTIYDINASKLYLYVTRPLLNQRLPEGNYQVTLSGRYVNTSTGTYLPLYLAENQMVLITQGNDWKLFRIEAVDNLIDMHSLEVSIFPHYSP